MLDAEIEKERERRKESREEKNECVFMCLDDDDAKEWQIYVRFSGRCVFFYYSFSLVETHAPFAP